MSNSPAANAADVAAAKAKAEAELADCLLNRKPFSNKGQTLTYNAQIKGYVHKMCYDAKKGYLDVGGWSIVENVGATPIVGIIHKNQSIWYLSVGDSSTTIPKHCSEQNLTGDYTRCGFDGYLNLGSVGAGAGAVTVPRDSDYTVVGIYKDTYAILPRVPLTVKPTSDCTICEEISQHEAWIAKLFGSIAERDAVVLELQQNKNKLQEAIKQHNDTLVVQDAVVLELQQSKSKLQEVIKQHNDTRVMRDAVVLECEQIKCKLKEAIKQRDDALDVRDATILEREQIKGKLQEAIDSAVSDCSFAEGDRDSTIAECDSEIEERDNLIQVLEQHLSSARNQLDSSQRERDTAIKERQEFSAQAQLRCELVAFHRSHLDDVRTERDDARTERDEARTERDEARIQWDSVVIKCHAMEIELSKFRHNSVINELKRGRTETQTKVDFETKTVEPVATMHVTTVSEKSGASSDSSSDSSSGSSSGSSRLFLGLAIGGIIGGSLATYLNQPSAVTKQETEEIDME